MWTPVTAMKAPSAESRPSPRRKRLLVEARGREVGVDGVPGGHTGAREGSLGRGHSFESLQTTGICRDPWRSGSNREAQFLGAQIGAITA